MERRAFIAGSAAAVTLAQIEPAVAATVRRPARANPLMSEWKTTWGAPPFAQIRTTDFTPAIEAGMAKHRAELAAIANNKAPATFENVIEALERAGRDLNKATTVFFNLSSMLSTPAIQRLEGPLSAKLSAHSSAISQDAALFARVKALYDNRLAMTMQPAQARLLELTYNGFVRDGALLNAAQKTRIAAIDAELSGFKSNLVKTYWRANQAMRWNSRLKQIWLVFPITLKLPPVLPPKSARSTRLVLLPSRAPALSRS